MEVQPKDTSKEHFYVSLVKSALRIAAGACVVIAGLAALVDDRFLVAGGALLIAAEILGIVEELV